MFGSNENRAEDLQINSNEISAAMANSVIPYGEQPSTVPGAITDGSIFQNELIVRPSDSTDNILVCLNDDCIIQVFEYLRLCDLCNVADVCRIFKSNALSVFKRRHSDLDLDELLDGNNFDDRSDYKLSDSDNAWNNKHEEYKIPVKGRRVRRFDMDTVINLFYHFGAYIKTIDFAVKDEDQKDEILGLMAIFCTHKDAELTKLILSDITIGPDLIPNIQCLFDRLKSLDMTGGSISSFPNGPELTELKLEVVYLFHTFTRELEKLHTLTLLNVEEISQGNIESLLLMSTQLKRLHIIGELAGDLNFFPLQLEELELELYALECDFIKLAELPNLRVLTVSYMDDWTINFFNNLVEKNVPIEELCLTEFKLAVEAATSLAGLSKIRKLSLDRGSWPNNVKLSTVVKGMPLLEQLYLSEIDSVDVDVVKSTIENAPKLKEFIVHFCERNARKFDERKKFTIDRSDYDEICKLIRKRLETRKLTLELIGIDKKLKVPDKIFERNKFWLDLKLRKVINICDSE